MSKMTVFLDTNEYKRCGHNFGSTPMRKIRELTSKETIELLTTTVVIGEVSQHIEEEVALFIDSQKALAQNAGIIRNLPDYSDIIRKISVEDLKQRAMQAFHDFLIETKCKNLSSNDINNDSLLSDFFSKRLPFEDNVKKGSEFKDAFIVYTLRKYADENDICINVISSDKGLCGALSGDDRFRIFSRSEELFAYITRIIDEIPAENAKSVQDFISHLKTEIATEIEEKIYDVGVWIDEIEEDGDIQSIEVKDIVLTYLDDLDENVLPIHIEVTIKLVVDYTYIDEENSYWDKEADAYLFVAKSDVRLTKQISLDFNAILDVEADVDGKIYIINSLDEFDIEDSRSGIRIEVDEDDIIELLHSTLNDYEEDYVPGAYTTCPDCGCKINFENDGGSGFCVICAPKH